MRHALAFLLLLTTTTALAQQPNYDTSRDAKNGSLVMNGIITFDDLMQETSFGWMRVGTEDYSPKRRSIKALKEHLPKYQMIVFLGTWCGDSKDLVPKLYKVLTKAAYPLTQVKIYGVDRTKKTSDGANEKFKITHVPTIILLDGDKEIGRITESVKKNMEHDLAEIVDK